MKTTFAIDVEGLTKSYGHKMVVRDLSIQVGYGQIYGFLGPNGSGKTTTIRMLCGLLKPDVGRGTCLGYDISEDFHQIKMQSGYMTQNFSLYQDLSIVENLDFIARLYFVKNRREAVNQTLEKLGLESRRRQLAGQLSGGWKQRLALAACILHSPKLLLLDEPTAGVDPKARREFWDEIHQLANEGMTVLVSTHYMDEAERCHKIAYISYGNLLIKGSVQEVIAASGLVTWLATGEGSSQLAAALRGKPGVDQIAAFGRTLHISGEDPAVLARTLAPFQKNKKITWEKGSPNLEDVFVQMTGKTNVVLNKVSFSFPRFWAILIKEFIQMWRDKGTFAMMVFLPIMQLMLFGFAINSDPKSLPTGLLNFDDSPFSRTILKSLENSEYFKFTHILSSEKQAQRLLDTGEIQFIVTIPVDFGRKLQRGERPAILIQADATDPTAMANALAATAALNPTVIDRDLVGPLQPLKGKLAPFEMRVHRLYNPEAITQYNIVPGLIGTILTLTMVVMTSVAVTREKERGTMEHLLSTPVRPIEVMLGKILPFIIVGYIQVIVILTTARFVFSVPIVGSLVLLSFVIIFFITANLSIGFTFSTVASNQLQASQMSTFFFLPSLLLSGFMYPFRGMPTWAQSIGEILPLTHFLRIVRGILLKGNGFVEVWPNLWPIILFMLGAMTLAMMRYRETLD